MEAAKRFLAAAAVFAGCVVAGSGSNASAIDVSVGSDSLFSAYSWTGYGALPGMVGTGDMYWNVYSYSPELTAIPSSCQQANPRGQDDFWGGVSAMRQFNGYRNGTSVGDGAGEFRLKADAKVSRLSAVANAPHLPSWDAWVSADANSSCMTVLSADATYAAPASESQGAAEFPAALLALMGFAGLVGMVRFGRRIG